LGLTFDGTGNVINSFANRYLYDAERRRVAKTNSSGSPTSV
jgi:YD repeat-containing protein